MSEGREKGSFVMVDKDGVEREFDILFTFESEETNKHYIAYTDNSKDENGKLVVYASSYDPKDENTELFPIETEKEWKIIETILTTLQEEMAKKMNEENAEQ